METNELIKFWKKLDVTKGPFIHPDDREYFEHSIPENVAHPKIEFENFDRNPLASKKNFVHFWLKPFPYMGDIKNADIFVLMINSGCRANDYQTETQFKFSDALNQNIGQNFDSLDPRFIYLNDNFSFHCGYNYWKKTFRGISKSKIFLNRIAVLQIFPYRTRDAAGLGKFVGQIPSSKLVIDFVENNLIPRCKRNEVCIIAARQTNNWGVSNEEERQNLIIYRGGETRGASISSNVRGGQAIINWMQ